MKICIGIPTAGFVRVETMLSVMGIMARGVENGHTLKFSHATGAYVQQNRTALINNAIHKNCDKVLFIDDDIIAETQALEKLLAVGKPVVAAPYNFKSLPLRTTVQLADKHGKPFTPEKLPSEPFRCFSAPTGFMLVDVPTVQKLPQPWFDIEFDKDGNLILSEDYYFCQKLRRRGVEIWCHPGVETRHIGTYLY